jgi:hypothetical protein
MDVQRILPSRNIARLGAYMTVSLKVLHKVIVASAWFVKKCAGRKMRQQRNHCLIGRRIKIPLDTFKV